MTESAPHVSAQTGRVTGARAVRVIGILVLVIGVVMVLAGAATWLTVRDQLADERIVVAEDASFFAGDRVQGPLTAYAQADVIREHAGKVADGRTYAQLDREDPRRQTMMTASFLRASLFTSVVAFGVAAMAVGIGIALVLLGVALVRTARVVALPG